MKHYPDFWNTVLGNGPRGLFFGFVFLAIVSAIGIIVVRASQKYKKIPGTPDQWSWKYFWADNLGNIVAGLFLIPIFVRLVYDHVEPTWMIVVSIGLGFGFFGLAELANSIGVWTTKKISERIGQKVKEEQESKP